VKRVDAERTVAVERSPAAEYDVSASKFLDAALPQPVDYEHGQKVVVRVRKVSGFPDRFVE